MDWEVHVEKDDEAVLARRTDHEQFGAFRLGTSGGAVAKDCLSIFAFVDRRQVKNDQSSRNYGGECTLKLITPFPCE